MGYDERTITKIKFSKNGAISVEAGTETLVMSKTVFTNFYLYEGKKITHAEIVKIKNDIKTDELYKYGLRLASKMSYSTKEVRDKLKMRENGEEFYKSVIARLKKEGFLNDEDYAYQYKVEKELGCYGKERIIETLRFEKGIGEDIISKLKFENEEEHASRFFESIKRKYEKLPYAEKKRKLQEAMKRRGFEDHVASIVLRGIETNKEKEQEYLFKVCKSALTRYKNKYNDKDAKRKTIEFLLRKGYSMKDIYAALEEQ